MFRATAIKLGIFAVIMVLIFVGLVVVFSQYRSGSTTPYTARFTDASQLKEGNRVRIAGVDVGQVTGVGLTADNQAQIGFDVDSTFPLPTSVHALIRYENLTGDRYLELQEGAGDPSRTLPAKSTIPVTQTEPALDLDKLLGGFKPLFKTLDAQQVNELSASLIEVFQGQGPALTQLLQNTAQFTDTLADRDRLIGDVIDNLNATLGTFQADSRGLDQSVDRLQQLITGLSRQRGTVGSALTNTSQLTTDLAGLLVQTRPDIRSTVTDTGKVSDEVLKGEPYVRGLLTRLPEDFRKLSNLGSYGAWLQIWLCQVNIFFTGPNGQDLIWRPVDDSGPTQNPGGRCRPR
ncbi:phospholipid/cholesterol/gamma-HCH transport system substrate-binding protein [Williamsia sterculiae]|uniref:Phospholipid/cholesterol/gamma-HCH transport system substrate-binding protein n=1 Tax=Williamsia sterculiae TaxID=1344003 RepID=A0A1N7CSG1_9NOCA|nr:phospholipid/cholesterol/gamma-HCH transport system substrate-binding protein [Williamsia sterculiae]